jgi:hypothetical protein
MKNTGFRGLVLTTVLVLLPLAASAQSGDLTVTGNAPKVDGSISAGEYSFQKDFGQMTLGLSRSADTLYVGLSGKTSGWIAVGLGSLSMNGASMFMGYVGADGNPQLEPQVGKGYRHTSPSGTAMNDDVVSYAIKERGGETIMELALKSGAFIKPDQKALDLIFSMGASKSTRQYHKYRNWLQVRLAR